MKLRLLIILFGGILNVFPAIAQLSTNDYQKALWMTTRMYGGNRSGSGPNWLILDNSNNTRPDFVKDADGSYDLTGGWHDCGDHVKFGQTQYYSAYVLLVGYSAYPRGYYDYYSPDYSGYRSSGNFTWEGGAGAPNGIPDILDEVKYATDYFIKCARNSTTFYSQVGNGNYDHRNWVPSYTMAGLSITEGGEASGSRAILRNPDDASMASFCGATLALMSRAYRPFDEAYADLCLQHAIYAYDYASAHQTNAGGGTISGSFYGPDNKWQDNYVCLCAELYWATNDVAYRTEALQYSSDVENNDWVLDYENNDELAAFALAKLGDAHGIEVLNLLCDKQKDRPNSEGVIQVPTNWGPLRYSANAAFSLALQHAIAQDGEIHSALQGTVDYIFGDNSANQSFVVGFGSNSPRNPHHRNVFNGGGSIPTRNVQHGYMVGGSYNPGSFPDEIDNYQTSEGGIDYNAGLVGALGYIISILDPNPINYWGDECQRPDLGTQKTLCGTNEVLLNSGLNADSRVFSWTVDGNIINGESSPTLIVTAPGEYSVFVDSAGCETSSSVEVIAELPQVELGDQVVINGSEILDAQVSGNGVEYQWYKDGVAINGATDQLLTVTTEGIYEVVLSANGCADVTDDIVAVLPPSIAHAESALTLDGEKESAYLYSYNVETVLSGDLLPGETPSSWSAVWTNDYLYVHVSVIDQNLNNDSGNSWWEDDGVEIFIDADNSKATSYDNNDFQWGFLWNTTDVVEGGNNPTGSIVGVEFIIVETTNGYNLEVAIPWTTMTVSPEEGLIIGIDVAINDDDDGDARDNKYSWNAIEDAGWQDPSYFGEAVLATGPSLDVQTIELSTGANLISFYVLPQDASVATVLSGVEFSYIHSDELFYSNTQLVGLNSLQQIELGRAYNIVIESSSVINVEGTGVSSFSIELKAGWNWVGMPLQTITDIVSVIDGLPIEVIRTEFDMYYPEADVYDFDQFIPGQGYYIKASEDCVLNW